MRTFLPSALALGAIVVGGSALFAGASVGNLAERLAGSGFSHEAGPQASKAADPRRVTAGGTGTWPLTNSPVTDTTDAELRLSAKPEMAHLEDGTSRPRVERRVAEPPAASSDSPATELDGRGEADLSLSRGQSGLPAPVPRPVASWQVAYARGHQAQVEGDLAAATQWYRQAARFNPEHSAIRYDLGYVLQLQGDADAAMAGYRKAIELNPDHPHAHYNLGFLLQKKGDEQGAVANYEKAKAISPDNPYVYYNLGLIHEQRNDFASARALYEKVIALVPERRPGIDAQRRLAALRPAPSVVASR